MNGDKRDDAAHSQHDAEETPILQGLPAVEPAEDEDAAGLEVAHDAAAGWAGFGNDGELRNVDQDGQDTAL